MTALKEAGFQFQIILSRSFQKTIEKLRNQQLERSIYESISTLARSFQDWKSLNAKKIDIGDSRRSIRSARVNEQVRIVYEGPIESARFGLVLFIHDVCNHDEYLRIIKRIAKAEGNEPEFAEVELTSQEMKQKSKGLDNKTAVFSKPIPIKVLLSPERMHAILSGTKANLLLTQTQMEALGADRPLLIHGQAGSGKTTLLCHRLALSIQSRRNQSQTRLVFISYNDKLVKQARVDTQEILQDQYGARESLEGVEFVSFQTFLKRYVQNPSRFEIDQYVPFGRFKGYYEMLRRGNSAVRKIPAEVAWHGIRSILKGACIPPSRPPLSHEAYKGLARRRKDFPQDMFDDIYDIGEWYQKEVIQAKELWDDQDLAWAALNWVKTEKERNPEMLLYDEIFCDEGQDLTEIEFRILVALCREPRALSKEGLPLVFSGDPLQTINPTGFRWSTVGSEVYRVQGKPVKLHELKENFRSDYRIVAFANQIQDVRSYYMEQSLPDQEAFEKDGDLPQIITADTEEETTVIQEKLGQLLPESAVIVWPEENDEVSRFYTSEKALSKVDRQLNLYSISEAKGLEFRLVVLYKFGSSQDVFKWKKYLVEKQKLPVEDEIPLLYFLNRLYVAVTRAKSFLVVVDTKAGIDDFWSIWSSTVYFLPRPDARNILKSHPAFQGEVSDDAWRKWAETLFEYAERTSDLRLYERARRAYQKANEIQKVKEIDARLMEIKELWEKAGSLYFDINDFERAMNCFAKAGKWNEAYKACNMLPTTPDSKRHMAIYKFKMGINQDARKATTEFFEYALEDEGLDRRYLEELGNMLLQAGDNERAARLFLRIGRSCSDKAALVQAANSFFLAGKSEEAERIFVEAGETKVREYQLSRAENSLRKGDLMKAAQLFFDNGAFEDVIDAYKLAKQQGGIVAKGQLLEYAAESYFKLGKYNEALAAYRMLRSEAGERADSKFLQRIAECLDKLGKKSEAYDYYLESGLYENAADIAQELGRPQEEILSLRIQGATEKADFDSAIRFAEEKGDERLVHSVKGRSYKYRKEYREAVPEFTKAEEWTEVFEALKFGAARGDFTYGEQFSQWCNIIKTVAESQKTLSNAEKEKIMEAIRQIQVDPIWEDQIPLQSMGIAYEKCATFVDAARYYESFIQEPWAREGWLRVKLAHRDFYGQRREFEKAERLDSEIRSRRSAWGF